MTLAVTTRRPDGARWCNAGSSSTGRTSCEDNMLHLQLIEDIDVVRWLRGCAFCTQVFNAG